MSVKQISVFLENKPGTLESMTAVLAENKIDIRGLSLAETKDFGIARLIVDDVYEATTVLKDSGFVNSLTPVLVVEIPDETGGLHKLLGAFSQANVNVEYMYAFLGDSITDKAYMIFRVADTKAAEKALKKTKLKLIDQDEIADI